MTDDEATIEPIVVDKTIEDAAVRFVIGEERRFGRKARDARRSPGAPDIESDGRKIELKVVGGWLRTRGLLLGTLVDDWPHLAIEDRRRLVGEVFAEVRVDAQGVRDFMPRDEWKPYMAAVIPATARVTAERKTVQLPAVGTQSKMRARDGGIDLRRAA